MLFPSGAHSPDSLQTQYPSEHSNKARISRKESKTIRLEVSGTIVLTPEPEMAAFSADPQKTALVRNFHSDLSQVHLLNPYRKCELACLPCSTPLTLDALSHPFEVQARPTTYVKERVAAQLRKELLGKKWKPQAVLLGGVTDPYLEIEEKLRLTRACLEILNDFRNPVSLITRSSRVLADLDLLEEMSARQQVEVRIPIPSLDENILARLEPGSATALQRLQTIESLAQCGIPVGVLISPVIPGLTDHELPLIVKAAAAKGVSNAEFQVPSLATAPSPSVSDWISTQFPDWGPLALGRIQTLAATKNGEKSFLTQLRDILQVHIQLHKLDSEFPPLSIEGFRKVEDPRQMWLFG